MGQVLRLNEFFVEGHEQEKSHVLLHIIQPSTPEEEKDKGYFFAVCEIIDGKKEDILMLQRLIDDIENEYYDVDNINTPEKNALETVLEKINQENHGSFSPETSLNCIIGVIIDKNLVFSYHGNPETLFFYQTKEGDYKNIGLLNQEEGPKDSEDNKIFPQIIQGKISPNDFFFVGTSGINDFFTSDRIQKIVTSRPPEQSAAHLEKVLSGSRSGLSFGGIIVHLKDTEAEESKHHNKIPPGYIKPHTVNPLFSAEQKTARTLSPSLMPDFGDRMKNIIGNKKPTFNEPVREPRPVAAAEINSAHLRQRQEPRKGSALEIIKTITQILAVIGVKIWALLVFIIKIILKMFKNILLLLVVAVNFKGRRKEILENWKNEVKYFKNKYHQMPLLTKILGITSILVAAVFISSIFYLQYNKRKAEDNKQYTSLMEDLKQQADNGESALIYNDTANALSIAQDLQQKLETNPCRTEDAGVCEELSGRIKNILAKARKMVYADPVVLVDWSVLGSEPVTKIFKIDSKVGAYSENSATINIYDTMTKENKTISNAPLNLSGFSLSATPKENDYTFILSADKKSAVKFNPDPQAIQNSEISFPYENANIRGIAIYSQRLYALDTQNNMIYRHSTTQNGFGVGNAWLIGEEQNLRDGVDLTIDGSIYVLKQNGEVYKFTKGLREDFQIQGVNPALTSADRIFTYNEWNNIYILDRSQNRILAIDKQGNLIRQYMVENMGQNVDMIVEETQGYIYLLSDNRLYQIEI